MPDVTQILHRIEQGDAAAAEELLPLVYDELRKLASLRIQQENPGQTLQATALVHEAYLRLVDIEEAKNWDSRGHSFAAAAEAMRRILVENARRKKRIKHGGEMVRHERSTKNGGLAMGFRAGLATPGTCRLAPIPGDRRKTISRTRHFGRNRRSFPVFPWEIPR